MKKIYLDKTLQILKISGSKGIHSFYLNAYVGDKNNTLRRINYLKKIGYNIVSKYERMGDTHGARYTLVSFDPKKKNRYKFEGNTATLIEE